jgi:hypothetical protein
LSPCLPVSLSVLSGASSRPAKFKHAANRVLPARGKSPQNQPGTASSGVAGTYGRKIFSPPPKPLPTCPTPRRRRLSFPANASHVLTWGLEPRLGGCHPYLGWPPAAAKSSQPVGVKGFRLYKKTEKSSSSGLAARVSRLTSRH